MISEILELISPFFSSLGFSMLKSISSNVLRSKFKEIENLYNDRLTKVHDDRKAELQKNLELKEALIEELKDLNQNEENIGKAFNRLDAIKKKWGGIGTVPKNKTTEIRHDYSQLVEEFYYHIKILVYYYSKFDILVFKINYHFITSVFNITTEII